MKKLMEEWRKYVAETEAEVEEAKNKDGKEQGADGKACWKGYKHAGTDEDGKDKCVPMEEELDESDCDDEEKLEEKPAKGKKSSKTYTNPDTGRKNKVSYGQKGAKIAPGTDKGDSYCARSNGIKKGLSKDKQNDPNTPNNLSRKKWKCSGDKSMKEAVSLDIEVGDIVLGGKYKNKRMEVKEIGTDELGQPTINGKPILKFRIEKHLPDEKKSKKTLEAEADE